ncbi:hypothetical protein SAMN07250955_107105 [Arboricoccus pini]|uniref:Uncharacterized protein n=2 Tax=Arboricoccus pini TaxID=1963835 RepID=A0A212RCU1_9PROT|nr:hypothetical protein SAMN07250955_107105 [Arboricoccus pini]
MATLARLAPVLAATGVVLAARGADPVVARVAVEAVRVAAALGSTESDVREWAPIPVDVGA